MKAAEPDATERPVFAPHSVDQLRAHFAEKSTRVFNARGISVKRCKQCMLGEHTCICPWRRESQCSIDWVLLLHRDEIFKPTNTGRLLADLFPQQSHAYCWDRTQPPAELLALLQDPKRRCFIIFPSDDKDPSAENIAPTLDAPFAMPADDERQLTLILLDGTWKQARKMYNKSEWLKRTPLLDLKHVLANDALANLGNYRVRQAAAEGQLATAEAAAAAFKACGQDDACAHLLDYFDVFNEHYVAMRMNRNAHPIDAHARIMDAAD